MFNEIYDAARRAVNDVLNNQFVRQGNLIHKRFGENTCSYHDVFQWLDNSLLILNKRLDEVESAVNTTQAEQTAIVKWLEQQVITMSRGLFSKYIPTGKQGDECTGILPLLEKLAQKYNIK